CAREIYYYGSSSFDYW
nr:immunoglobulin heavy chain junction region [Mus musculus]MBK4189074.1 immunoglobulin heavy chain junction region [Mus musculus]MBK4189075.1 immunoglobulin heavy chain junction region [Mus musculus]